MTPYTPGERALLMGSAAVAGVGLNGAFLYGAAHPQILAEALGNPIAVAFVLEAFLLVGLLAWLLHRRGLSKLPWHWFLLLSVLGGVGFALPVALLWRSGRRTTQPD